MVGKIDRQTPELKSKIHEINFNPYWRVPKSIVRKDLVPKARQYVKDGLDLIDAYKLEVFDARGKKMDPYQIDWFSDDVYNYSYRQLPWEENSLGFVKINFHNKHSVYLHDTPLKDLFGSNFRAQSSGCVRVQNVETLAAWLLRENPGWNASRVIEMKHTRRTARCRFEKARAALPDLSDGVGDARRHCPVPPRHLSERRRRHHRIGILSPRRLCAFISRLHLRFRTGQ